MISQALMKTTLWCQNTVKNNAHVRHFASESFPADLKEPFTPKKVVFSLFGSLPDDPFNLE